jgi:hypothetical protein
MVYVLPGYPATITFISSNISSDKTETIDRQVCLVRLVHLQMDNFLLQMSKW